MNLNLPTKSFRDQNIIPHHKESVEKLSSPPHMGLVNWIWISYEENCGRDGVINTTKHTKFEFFVIRLLNCIYLNKTSFQ